VPVADNVVKELIDAGIHFGHRVSRWNPKMAPYIFGKRNLIHIIDVKETLRGLLRAQKFLRKLIADGKDVLIVGTKRQARQAVLREAERTGMPYVIERWLGGTLTNFRTIRSRLARLEELEAMEADGSLQQYSKKMISSLTREKRKITRNLAGIRTMDRLPGALILIDPHKEHIAVKEARKLGIPTVALLDTDSDPDLIDLPIPGNDDAMRAIDLICKHMGDAIAEGKAGRVEAPAPAADRPKRPRRRTPTRKAEPKSTPPAPEAKPAPAAPEAEAAPEAPEAKATPAAPEAKAAPEAPEAKPAPAAPEAKEAPAAPEPAPTPEAAPQAEAPAAAPEPAAAPASQAQTPADPPAPPADASKDMQAEQVAVAQPKPEEAAEPPSKPPDEAS
jgi:small subunit ribosomal protein S2